MTDSQTDHDSCNSSPVLFTGSSSLVGAALTRLDLFNAAISTQEVPDLTKNEESKTSNSQLISIQYSQKLPQETVIEKSQDGVNHEKE